MCRLDSHFQVSGATPCFIPLPSFKRVRSPREKHDGGNAWLAACTLGIFYSLFSAVGTVRELIWGLRLLTTFAGAPNPPSPALALQTGNHERTTNWTVGAEPVIIVSKAGISNRRWTGLLGECVMRQRQGVSGDASRRIVSTKLQRGHGAEGRQSRRARTD